MNAITTSAIAATNEARQKQVVAQARELIDCILQEQGSIKGYRESMAKEQEAARKLAADTITQASVMGTEMTGTLNENQVTIAKAIKDLNDAKQQTVELRARNHINNVSSYEGSIKACEARIAGLREKLAALSVDVVTNEVLG